MMPPRWIRRLLLAPATVALAVVLLATLPAWLLLVLLLTPLVPGKLRLMRVVWLAVLYIVLEAVALIALFAIWLGTGFGYWVRAPWSQRAHYALAGRYLQVLFFEARRVLKLRIEVDGPDPDARPGYPLLVMCRHAGPGDSLVLVHSLVNWYAREPRIVLKDTLQWDPAVDVMLNRLPTRFLAPRPEDPPDHLEHQIAELATALDENDAFVIFPEGGNFTPRRRMRAIDRLRRLGHRRMADRAARMRHVLAPRPGGVVAALSAAPEADVMLVAHAGLDHLLTVADVWRALPTEKTITMRWWRVPAADIPRQREAQIDWLFGWWERIDEWIADRRAATPPRS
jgi:1-acyl-sn-glycerol-3-phosphate acyltransferase